MSFPEEELRKIKHLHEIKNLYECRIKCLSAISFVLENDIQDPDTISLLFDPNKECAQPSIREFLGESVQALSKFCVCDNLDNQIQVVAASLISFEDKKIMQK